MFRSFHPQLTQSIHWLYQSENVPEDAIAMPISNIDASHFVHFLSMAIFAQIGPMTHMRKEKQLPRIPIIELNSGTAIETATAMNVMRIR
jgi:hypothetical protein